MHRIAHLSDLHMLDPHAGRSNVRYRIATKFVSVGRPIDPRGRAKKLARALAAAKKRGVDHVVITGDLTEVGADAEFEHLASVLHDAGFPAGAITLVPGNHDAYTSAAAWRKALSGPLRSFASASAEEAGKVIDRGEVVYLPIDTSRFQSIARSGGQFTRDAAEAIERRLVDPAFRGRTTVLVLHHPPFLPASTVGPVWQWIDGLGGRAQIVELLLRHPRLQLFHGHLHRVVDRIVELGKTATSAACAPLRRSISRTGARIFGASATVDDAEELPRVRFYDVDDGALHLATEPSRPGRPDGPT